MDEFEMADEALKDLQNFMQALINKYGQELAAAALYAHWREARRFFTVEDHVYENGYTGFTIKLKDQPQAQNETDP